MRILKAPERTVQKKTLVNPGLFFELVGSRVLCNLYISLENKNY